MRKFKYFWQLFWTPGNVPRFSYALYVVKQNKSVLVRLVELEEKQRMDKVLEAEGCRNITNHKEVTA